MNPTLTPTQFIDGDWVKLPGSSILDPSRTHSINHLMLLVDELGKESTCARGQVGCVVTDFNLKMVAVGHNHKLAIHNVPCADLGCDTSKNCQLTIHAETDAFSKVPIDANRLVVILPMSPCINCLKLMYTRKVACIIFPKVYKVSPDTLWAYEKFVHDCGIKFYWLEQ